METCRTCAKCVFYNESTNWIELFHPTACQQECQQILRELEDWQINISINDGLPQKICADCFAKLCNIHTFHTACEEAQQRLNTIFDKIDDIVDAEEEAEVAAEEAAADANELLHEMQVSRTTEQQLRTTISINGNANHNNNTNNSYTAPYECASTEGNHVADSSNHNNDDNNDSYGKEHIPQFAVLLVEELPFDDLIEEDNATEDAMIPEMDMESTEGHKEKEVLVESVFVSEPLGEGVPVETLTGETKVAELDFSFECKYCYKGKNAVGEQYATQALLYAHITECHDSYEPYTCPFCPEQFADAGQRTGHIKDKHIKKDYECEVCGKRYAQRLNLKEHFEKFHSDKDFMCNICDKSFFSLRSLKYHKKWHNSKLLNCSYCDRIFINKMQLHNHEATHTGLRKLEYCTHCGKSFCHMKGLRYHLYSKHGGEKPYKCAHCTERFASYREKRLHMLDRHQNNLTPLEKTECMMCHNFFKDESALKEHILTVHEGRRKPLITENNKRVIQSKKEKCFTGVFQCEKCTQRFNMRSALERHKVMHSSEGRPHKCPKCQKHFKRLPDLNWHLKTHSDEKPNICDVCGKGFALKYVLNQHRRSHEVLEKNFTCTTCGRSYFFEKSLRSHERTHTGHTYYTCDLCGETFVTHIKFKWHMTKEHSDAENVNLYDNSADKDAADLPTEKLFEAL